MNEWMNEFKLFEIFFELKKTQKCQCIFASGTRIKVIQYLKSSLHTIIKANMGL